MNKIQSIPCLALLAGSAMSIASTASAAVVARWDFDLPESTSVGSPFVSDTDTVSGLVATGNATPTYGSPAPGGGTASALLGSTSYLSVPDSGILTGHADGGTGFTQFQLELDIKLNALITSGTQQIVRKTGLEGANGPGFELYAQSGGLVGFSINNAAGTQHKTQGSGFLTEADTWYHLVAQWDGANITLTVDGVQVGTPVAYAGPFVDTDVALGIGALIRSNGTVGQQFDGAIDNLVISNAVPEPATLALCAGGVLLATRRRSGDR